MRLRPRTIRTQLVALLVVPLVSLAGLWSYSTLTSVRGAVELLEVADTSRYYGTPTGELAQALQAERLETVTYIASGRSGGSDRLARLQRNTDVKAGVLRAHAAGEQEETDLDSAQREHLDRQFASLEELPGLRRDARVPSTPWIETIGRYNQIIEPGFGLRRSLAALQTTGDIVRQGIVVAEFVRARELLSQEDALIAGAQLSDEGLTEGQYRDLIGTIDGRKLLHRIYARELPPQARLRFEAYETGSAAWTLDRLESTVRGGTPATVGLNAPVGVWQETSAATLAELSRINVDASEELGAAARDTGLAVFLRVALVGAAGLLAVVLSVVVSLRLGGRLARRLTALRDEALDLSGTRLPEVMRRLRAGDDIGEVEASAVVAGEAAPARLLGSDEIGQVGRAFDNVQRATVHAAAEQERLRRGVSAVFTTLARRSQVLLHRQLTLLDTMERRTEDPSELDDLFRLDHMSTRMRRHAESLLILSGSAPGRAWRKPVRLAEVIRAAVGEVEDYPRVNVRRMPRVALSGAAVADILHLLAELIENAAVFSPPDTKVVVRGEPVADGFALEIEDSGLGMSPGALATTNAVLGKASDGPELPESDRLGLFVVRRLAARQDVRVTLREGRLGGTVAVVLLPHTILAVTGDDAETGEHGIPRPQASSDRAPVVPPVTRMPVNIPAQRPESRATVSGGLPKRVRQASLVQQLMDPDSDDAKASRSGDGGRQVDSGGERSPEEARSTMTQFARGLARGRGRPDDASQPTGENGE